MLSRWTIEESPTKRDPQRRLLFVKGSLADVHGLIRRLGAVCGRPKKEKGNPDFNFSLALRKAGDDEIAEIESELRSLCPNGSPAVPAAEEAPAAEQAPAAESPPSDAGGGGLPIEIAVASGSGPAPIEEAPTSGDAGSASSDAPAPAQSPEPAPLPEAESGGPAGALPISIGGESTGGEPQAKIGEPITGLSLSSPDAPPAESAPAPDPGAPAGEEATPAVFDLGTAPAAESAGPFSGQGPPIAGRVEESSGASPSTPEPVPVAPSGAESPAPESGGLEKLVAKPLYGAIDELDASRTLDNFVVGGFNRFAHAGAMSILTSPGTLYQPLFIHGPPGTGKSHLMHGIASKLQQQDPDAPVWITSGARLARAAAWAESEGKFSELEEYAKKSRALLVDDLQFMGVADHNRAQLVALFKHFADEQKQVVLTSAYPPTNVAAIEQAIEIRISGGHTAELKAATGDKRIEAVVSAMDAAGLGGSDEEKAEFARAAAEAFGDLSLTLRRSLVLQSLRAAAGQPAGLADMQGSLFQPDTGEPQVIAAEELEKQAAQIPSPAGGSRSLLLLHPHGQEAHAEWALRQVAAAAQMSGWNWPFADAVRKDYAVDPAPTVPFMLAEEAYQHGADAVLVLGPQPGADLAEYEGDCRYVLQHLLSDGGIPLGWVPYRRVHDPKFHLHAFLDLNPEPQRGGVA